jgi:hypothetical protein
VSGSIICGDYQVRWYNPGVHEEFPVQARLVVTAHNGERIFEMGTDAWFPQTIQPLWCEDILRGGVPALAYTTYSGGAHCCWDVRVLPLEDSPRWLLSTNLGNVGELTPDQLDGAGPLELTTKSDVFAFFGDLPSFVSPYLPLVFAYDGKAYAEATVQFPDHISADLEDALADLSGRLFEERAGKALRALGDYVLLGQEEKGLTDLKARVSGDVAAWLDEYSPTAVMRVKKRYNFQQ